MAATPRILLIASPLMSRTPALERALGLTKVMDAALHIIAFDYLEGLAKPELSRSATHNELRSTYPERHRQWLQEQVSKNSHLGLKITTEARWINNVTPEILDYVGEARPDWLIKDVYRESLLARVMFTSQDMHLLHLYPNRLHLVANAQQDVPRQIMVAVDIHHHDDQQPGLNERLIHEGMRLGMECNAQVHLVYAYGLSLADPAEWGKNGGAMTSSAILAQEMYDAMNESFDALAERVGVDREHRHMLIGNPRRALLRFAEAHRVDVMVMGRSDRIAPDKWLGSTTEHVMNKMHSSLLVIN
jgi:universal stress protein E